MRYAVIEDTARDRSLLKRLIARIKPEAVCTGEAPDGDSGLQLLRASAPEIDLLFLDIEFPPEGAFGLLQSARAEGLKLPHIAFVTASDEHALTAFRWAACDYVVKPVSLERLRETLDRVGPSGPDVGVLLGAVRAAREQKLPERFVVHEKGRLLVLQWSEVSHLTTENRLLLVHTPRGRFVLDRSIDELEALLAPRWMRIHRSAMVALDKIREITPEPKGGGEVLLEDGANLPVSRERMAALRKALLQ